MCDEYGNEIILDLGVDLYESRLVSVITPDVTIEAGADVAFYVYRGNSLIHTQWYAKVDSFEFDTQGVSGSYRIIAFIKLSTGRILNASSGLVAFDFSKKDSTENKAYVQKLEAEQRDGKICCQLILNDNVDADTVFAFYVFRNDEKVHTQWYSKSTHLEYDAAGLPGYFRVEAFAKRANGFMESIKSAPLFMNPVSVTAEEFPSVDQTSGAFLFKGEHWDFPALYFPSKEEWLYVMMPSAIDRKRMILPVFSRWTWAMKGSFPGHVLCVADPTLELHQDLNLGWCLGTSTQPATDELAQFIETFAAAKGIPKRKIVFWGSSAGGFAALAVASRIPESTAVAINAQTDALSYEIRRQVALVRQACFGTDLDTKIRGEFNDMVDMSERWKNAPHARAFIVQNKLDIHHYETHFRKFWTTLGGSPQDGFSRSGPHIAWVYSDVNGHVAETPEMVQKIIQIINNDFKVE